MSACSPAPLTVHQRSRCRVLPTACFYNGTVYHRCSIRSGGTRYNSGWQPLHQKVRMPWTSHTLIERASMSAEPMAAILDAASRASSLINSSCLPPLIWTPTWMTNFADTFLSSVVPLLELEAVGVVTNRSTLLVADTMAQYAKPGCIVPPNMPCRAPRWFEGLLRRLHLGPVAQLHELSGTCMNGSPRGCPPPRACRVEY